MTSQIIPSTPQKFLDIIKNAFFHCKLFYKDSVLLAAFISQIPTALTGGITSNGYLALLSVFQAFFYSVLILRVNAILNNRALNWSGIFIHVSKRFIPNFALVMLYLLIVVAGVLLFIIPGIFLLVSLIMSSLIFWLEDQSIINSLRGSFDLVKNNWWRSSLLLVVWILIALVFSFVNSLSAHIPLLQNLILCALCSLLILYQQTLFIEFYYDLKNRKSMMATDSSNAK